MAASRKRSLEDLPLLGRSNGPQKRQRGRQEQLQQNERGAKKALLKALDNLNKQRNLEQLSEVEYLKAKRMREEKKSLHANNFDKVKESPF